jgi:hypothetical protein
MITKMHLSRASPRREHQQPTPTSPARTGGANGLRERARVVLPTATCVFLCPAAHSVDGSGGDARQVDYRPAHARASSVPDHAQGTVVLPLGAQTGCSVVVSQIANIPHIIRSSGGQPAHNTSHPMPCLQSCHLSRCAYHRLPLLAYFPR